jgi:hypothetical protein
MHSFCQGYDELRLRLDRRSDGGYHVLAGARLAEATADFELPFTEAELETFIGGVGRGRGHCTDFSRLDDAKRFGGTLFKAVFRDQVRDVYRDAMANARSRNHGLRVTLCLSGSPALVSVPWEYLFDDPDFLSLSALTPVVRSLDLPRPSRALPVEPPLRILGVVSSPAEYASLDVDRERENLERALAEARAMGAVELHWLGRPTLSALLRALRAETFHALHYIGHGTVDASADHGVLLFEDDSGWARPVSGDQLGMILRDFSSLRLAVLNACDGTRTTCGDPFSSIAGSLVHREIPAVVAMQFEISDAAAIAFGGAFYEALAAGCPVDSGLAAARLSMFAECSHDIEWGTPVLFMRVPDGRIFDLPQIQPRSSLVPDPTAIVMALTGHARSLMKAAAASCWSW